LNDGFYVFLEGAEYPMQGFSTPKFMADANIAKRMLMGGVKVLSQWWMIPGVLVALAFNKYNVFVEYYTESAYKVMRDHVLKDQFQTPFAKELEWMIYCFVNNINIRPYLAQALSEIISMIISGDSAYRFRVMDMFNEVNKEALTKNPSKEIKRLMALFAEREKDPTVTKKFQQFALLISVAFMVPKIRKTFIEVVDKVDFNKLKFDEIESYWACLFNDYNSFGKNDEERRQYIGDASIPVLQ